MDEMVIERKLDAIGSILKLAFREQLDQAREEIRSEPGKAAILDAATNWISAGDLTSNVARKVAKSERTIQRYISLLLDLGVIEQRGAGPTVEYRANGII